VGRSEQDSPSWTAAPHDVIHALRRAHPEFADLPGNAVYGQMHGATLLDRRGKALRLCILWKLTRSHAQAAALLQKSRLMRALTFAH
jgi:xylulokinase